MPPIYMYVEPGLHIVDWTAYWVQHAILHESLSHSSLSLSLSLSPFIALISRIDLKFSSFCTTTPHNTSLNFTSHTLQCTTPQHTTPHIIHPTSFHLHYSAPHHTTPHYTSYTQNILRHHSLLNLDHYQSLSCNDVFYSLSQPPKYCILRIY